MNNIGTIVQVIGPVVDVDFSDAGALPRIYEALEIQFTVDGVNTRLVPRSATTSRAKAGCAPLP
jgi:F-type H+-transporting ATPase subunit beta